MRLVARLAGERDALSGVRPVFFNLIHLGRRAPYPTAPLRLATTSAHTSTHSSQMFTTSGPARPLRKAPQPGGDCGATHGEPT